jgi:predicted nuclease of predicted toxin-antitoxin system
MFIKHKPRLYFDENFPVEAIEHFRSPYWKKRLWITSAGEQGHQGQSDRFHYSYCQRHGHTLVTLDDDFNDDRLYPFIHGKMPGIIIIKAKSADVVRIANMLVTLLSFLLRLPFPKGFLAETKFIVAQNGVVMRGRHSRTRQVKTLQVFAGITTARDVRSFFGYFSTT